MNKPLADWCKLPEFDVKLQRVVQGVCRPEARGWHRAGHLEDQRRPHASFRHVPSCLLSADPRLSLDFKNEIIIFTHIGDNWMIEGPMPTAGRPIPSCPLSVSRISISTTPT